MIHIVCWKWSQAGCRSKYTAQHVNVWANMIRRNYQSASRLLCVTDDSSGIDIETYPLWNDFQDISNPYGKHLPSCYRRLKLFSSKQTEQMQIPLGSIVLWLDLDIVVVRNITKMINRIDADFAGWKRIGPTKPVGYNGSMIMFRTGTTDDIWDNFDPQLSPTKTRRAGQYGSDQGWISMNRDGNGAGWTQVSGMYSFTSDVQKVQLPTDARIVSFNGRHKPWNLLDHQRHTWIRRCWQ